MIAIIHETFGPYHRARVREFVKISRRRVCMIQLAAKELTRGWLADDRNTEPDLITLTEGCVENTNQRALADRLEKCLDQLRPEAVVYAGYSHPAMRRAAAWARRHQCFSVMMSDSQERDHPRQKHREFAKSLWIRRYAKAAFVSGSSAAAYLRKLNYQEDRIWRGYDVVDNDYFEKSAKENRVQGAAGRGALGLPERYFLYVGRLSQEKNLSHLLLAYAAYRKAVGRDAWGLVMVGAGSMEQSLKTRSSELNLNDIIWAGNKPVDQLPAYYAHASALCLPSSSEPWGLVVNEAMASGLPVMVSTACGCYPDLIFPGINGYVFDPASVTDIDQTMRRLTALSDVRRRQMGDASASIIANYTPWHWAQSLGDCIERGLSK